MAAPAPALSFDTAFDAAAGTPVTVAPNLVRITAPNSGPYTFTGTNTFILGAERVAIVDPGPRSDSHLNALLGHIDGRAVEAIVLTHTHRDHCDLVQPLRERIDAPLWFGGRHRRSRPKRWFEFDWTGRESDFGLVPDQVLEDGQLLEVAGLHLDVVATPGHCANHLCFGIAGSQWMLSGDHVMGWSSTVIAVPDGSMADYLGSLEKLQDLPYVKYLPAHGGPIKDGPALARALQAHREARNEEVVRAVNGGARRIGDLLATIYPTLSVALQPAARMTLKAHVEYLAAAGRIRARPGWTGLRLAPAT